MEPTEEKIFHQKLDVYYITLLGYLVIGAIYILIRGNFIGETFSVVVHDPVVYLFGIFIGYAALLLLINVFRDRRIIITPRRLIFRDRFREKVIFIDHIEKIVFRRERRFQYEKQYAMVKLKLADRRRWIRIRIAWYERENELFEALKELKEKLNK